MLNNKLSSRKNTRRIQKGATLGGCSKGEEGRKKRRKRKLIKN
jgi:hypothetical protein